MKLRQNLSQTTKMTLQMQESIKLLQLSNQEIINYIDDSVKNNPFLEFEKNKKIKKNKIEITEKNLNQKKIIRNYESFLNNNNIENTPAGKPNLRERVTEQLNIDIKSHEDKFIGKLFIKYLDPNGYIHYEDMEKIYLSLGANNNSITKKKVEKLLKKLQKFDPPGIFSRNLSECLKIQLKDKKIWNQNYKLLLNNLELIAKNKIGAIRKMLKLNEDEIRKMIKIIKGLNPKPGSAYDAEEIITIVPDIYLEVNHGIFKVNINKNYLPKISFNKNYYEKIKEKKLLRREKNDLNNWANNGRWLISALKNRTSTLEKVTKEIIKFQKDFFLKGIEYIKPLTLKEIARKTDFHESTISRATTNKFIECPKGTFELKFFFSTGLECGPNAEVVSNKTIKDKILLIVKDEKKNNKVMSDEKIVLNLKNSGINIARRTVAKYRKLLNIPSSSIRKEGI